MSWLERLTRGMEVREFGGTGGGVYMRRHKVAGFRGWSCWLHCIKQPDPDGELHNHPWSAWSLILTGGYVEERLTDQGFRERRRLTSGSINRIGPLTFHRIAALVGTEAWTLVVAGPTRRPWGWLDARLGFVEWREWLRGHGVEPDERLL